MYYDDELSNLNQLAFGNPEGIVGGLLPPVISTPSAPVVQSNPGAQASTPPATTGSAQVQGTGGSGGILGGIFGGFGKALFGDAISSEEEKLQEAERIKKANANLNAQLSAMGSSGHESLTWEDKYDMLQALIQKRAEESMKIKTPKTAMELEKEQLDLDKSRIDLEKKRLELEEAQQGEPEEPPDPSNTIKLKDDYEGDLRDNAVRQTISASRGLFPLYKGIQDGNSASQTAFITSVAKVFDPNSVVNGPEGDVIANPNKLPPIVQNAIQAASGGTLTKEDARKIMQTTVNFTGEKYKIGQEINIKHGEMASHFRVDPKHILDDYNYDRIAKRLVENGLEIPHQFRDRYVTINNTNEMQNILPNLEVGTRLIIKGKMYEKLEDGSVDLVFK
jgi:hypothetical protein